MIVWNRSRCKLSLHSSIMGSTIVFHNDHFMCSSSINIKSVHLHFSVTRWSNNTEKCLYHSLVTGAGRYTFQWLDACIWKCVQWFPLLSRASLLDQGDVRLGSLALFFTSTGPESLKRWTSVSKRFISMIGLTPATGSYFQWKIVFKLQMVDRIHATICVPFLERPPGASLSSEQCLSQQLRLLPRFLLGSGAKSEESALEFFSMLVWSHLLVRQSEWTLETLRLTERCRTQFFRGEATMKKVVWYWFDLGQQTWPSRNET